MHEARAADRLAHTTTRLLPLVTESLLKRQDDPTGSSARRAAPSRTPFGDVLGKAHHEPGSAEPLPRGELFVVVQLAKCERVRDILRS